MKRLLLLLLCAAIVSVASADVFSLANNDFSSATWEYTNSGDSFLLKGFSGPAGSTPIQVWEITGDVAPDDQATHVVIDLYATGPWDAAYVGTYYADNAQFTDYQNFRLLMTAANDDTVSFEGQSWVVDDYAAHEFTRAQITIVPEPATMAILGLGGLFVAARRRKA